MDENGAMTVDFVIGDYDSSLLESKVNESLGESVVESDQNWEKN